MAEPTQESIAEFSAQTIFLQFNGVLWHCDSLHFTSFQIFLFIYFLCLLGFGVNSLQERPILDMHVVADDEATHYFIHVEKFVPYERDAEVELDERIDEQELVLRK